MLMVVVRAVLAVVRVVLGVVAPLQEVQEGAVHAYIKNRTKNNTSVLKPERIWQRRSPTRRHACIFFSWEPLAPQGPLGILRNSKGPLGALRRIAYKESSQGGARRSQGEPGGARRSQGEPGGQGGLK